MLHYNHFQKNKMWCSP